MLRRYARSSVEALPALRSFSSSALFDDSAIELCSTELSAKSGCPVGLNPTKFD